MQVKVYSTTHSMELEELRVLIAAVDGIPGRKNNIAVGRALENPKLGPRT